MGQKACDKCGELVDEAKAFCPACGNAFVDEEQRQDTSAFEKMDNTVQMGKTMYGQMLTDMGLNISKSPDAPAQPEKRVEVIAPLTTNATPAANVTPPPEQQAAPPAKKSYLVWIIVGAFLLLFLLILLISIAGVIFYYYGNRIT